jgi:hypothetical protein
MGKLKIMETQKLGQVSFRWEGNGCSMSEHIDIIFYRTSDGKFIKDVHIVDTYYEGEWSDYDESYRKFLCDECFNSIEELDENE